MLGDLYGLFSKSRVLAMPSYTRMKRIFLDGLLWLFLFQYGLMALSLEPGFLDFDNLPDTNFTCVGKVIGGYYADLETNCQMFHVCTIGQADEPMDIRFLCLNGTVFDQETRVCERIDEVDCSKSEKFYSLNLELYGNSGPILEETPEVPQETEPPSIIIKSTTTTITPSTTTKWPTPKTATPHYYTTIRPSTATTSSHKPQTAGHHFPVNPDIRFNPEEINISLNAGAPPDIRTKHFQPHAGFGDSAKLLVTDNEEEQSVRVQKPERVHLGSSTSPKSIYAIDDSDRLSQNSDDDFGFPDEFHGTEPPRQQQFLIQTNSFRHSQSFPPNVNHNSNQYHHPQFHSTTIKQQTNFHQDPGHTTLRTLYLPSLKPSEVLQHHHYTHHPRTEKTPQRVQIPIPLLPTLPPLTFSSPAPFALQRHIETKRYTKDHPAPPRIIISASASVSDASGRRLNYSLGTIGAAQILETPPSSYDDYKDGDVGLDPFYHDVPKVNQRNRKKRSAENPQINPFDVIKNEKEALDVLKFLYTWYQSHQATATVPSVTSPVSPDLIKSINYELAPALLDESTLKTESSDVHITSAKEPTSTESSLKPHYDKSELFTKSSRFSIIGGYRNDNVKPNSGNFEKSSNADQAVATELKEKMDNADETILKEDSTETPFNPNDYVDDNYEGVVYKQNNTEQQQKQFIDPSTISELYKYFNLNNQLSTTNAPSKSSETIKQGGHTEVNLHDGSLKDSSSTTEPPIKPSGRRRLKGRQQQQADDSQDSVRKSTSKRVKTRGRSRFTGPNILSSTTTEYVPLVVTPSADEISEISPPELAGELLKDSHSFQISTRISEPTEESVSVIKHYLIENTTVIEPNDTNNSNLNQTVEDNKITEAVDVLTTEIPVEIETEPNTSSTSPASDDPTYLIKLLKYFADDAMILTTELPAASYEPLTENQLTSTPSMLLTVKEEAHHEPRRNRHRTKYRHSSRVSTTELPTLRDLNNDKEEEIEKTQTVDFKTTNLPDETLEEDRHIKNKSLLLEKLQLIEQNLTDNLSTLLPIITPIIVDTTATTPLMSFENRDSYGTTLPSLTEPTKFTESSSTTAPSQELTKMFEISTEPINSSFYDDLFVVPEKSHINQDKKEESDFMIKMPEDFVTVTTSSQEYTTEPMKTTIDDSLVTTSTPDVEIQKSISLPISVLEASYDAPQDINDAHLINDLVSTENTIPSTQITSEHPTATPENDVTETVPITTMTTELPFRYVEDHLKHLQDTVMPEVQQNATEIIFLKSTQPKETMHIETPGMVNSSHLLQVVLESTTNEPTTTTTISPYHTRRTRPSKKRPYNNNNNRSKFGRHRFSTELFTNKPPKTEEPLYKQNLLTSQISNENVTDAPLHRSATPTRSELKKVLLHTTPLSSKNRLPIKVGAHYVFNCFGKEINRFYADPRDCRLFHYCTQGYSKNQLLDLKYVCDQKTFFDDERLTCTDVKPARCL